MAKVVRFPFEESGPERLQLDISPGYAGVVARVDGLDVLQLRSREALVSGGRAVLADGTTLSVRLLSSKLLPMLEVLRNGYPVPGSATHPDSHIRVAAKALLVIAAFSAIFAMIQSAAGGATSGATIGSLVECVLFAVSGAFTWRRARWAFYAGVGLYTIESVFQLIGFTTASNASAAGGIFGFVMWRTIFYLIFWRAFVAFRDAGRRDPNAVAATFR